MHGNMESVTSLGPAENTTKCSAAAGHTFLDVIFWRKDTFLMFKKSFLCSSVV